MKLFARQEDGSYREVVANKIHREVDLQNLLASHSDLLPLNDLDPHRAVVREFPTSAGPIDHLVIDATGRILVVETKLAKNADRRSVVAQAIDYAAQLTKYGPQALLDAIRERLGSDFTEGWFDGRPERDTFLRDLETNLRLGRLTLLIVMDHAEQLLKDAVRFINRATHFSCLLAEITIVDVDGRKMVGIDVYGQEIVDDKTQNTDMDDREFIQVKGEEGMGDEAKAFAEALTRIENDGETTYRTSSGLLLQGRPLLGNHYLSWQARARKIAVWAPAEEYEAVKGQLEAAPGHWSSRVSTRALKADGKYGKVADVEPKGIKSAEAFLELFRHYLAAPTGGAD